MNKRAFAVVMLLACVALTYIAGCKKEEDGNPLEPISLVTPDSSIIRKFPGDSLPLEIKFTTDRPINWVQGLYDLDTADHTTGIPHIPTYPDTMFLVHLDTLDPRVNLYTYTGTFSLPDEPVLQPYDVIRFKVTFHAGKSTFTVGQNYPKGIVTTSKEFRVDVR